MRRWIILVRLLTVALAWCLAFVAWQIEHSAAERHTAESRAAAQAALSQVRDQLENRLVSNLQLVRGLVSVITLDPNISQARFEVAARPLFSDQTQLRNIAVAPDMVIRLMYPLAGNERAIGLAYLTLPGQRETAQLARETGKIVLAGPLPLAQGGMGLIARMPVSVPDGQGGERFWGLISSVIDPDRLWRDSGLLDNDMGIRVAIRGRDGTGADGAVFFGEAGLFDQNPVTSFIQLPLGSWQIGAIPTDGWTRAGDNVWPMRLAMLGVAVVLLGAFLALGRALQATAAARQLAESARRQLAATLEGNPQVAVQWYRADGRVAYWNHAAEAIFGWTAAEAQNQRAADLMLTPEQATEFANDMHSVLRGGAFIGPKELAIRSRNGSPRWVASTVFGIPGDADSRLCVRMDVDITDRKAAENLLRDAMQRAEAATETKSRFLATMSHEIKTPLNGILGMAQLLLMPSLSREEQQEFARTIHNSGKTLLMLLNDLLDLSKMDAGKLELRYVAFDAQQTVHEVLALFGELGEAKGLAVETVVTLPPDARYWADGIRIRQMLSNLMSNAIKFTNAGYVRIECFEVARDDSTALLEFAVADSGVGIADDEQPLLFEAFTQADSSITREHGGTGLGLSIVRNLATLHGGSVGIQSAPGQGARVWIRVRVRLGQAGEERRARSRD